MRKNQVQHIQKMRKINKNQRITVESHLVCASRPHPGSCRDVEDVPSNISEMILKRTNPSADTLVHATHANRSPTTIEGSSSKNWNGNWSEWIIQRHHGAYILPHISDLTIDPTLYLQEGNAQPIALHFGHIEDT